MSLIQDQFLTDFSDLHRFYFYSLCVNLRSRETISDYILELIRESNLKT